MKRLKEYIITESKLSDKVFCEQFSIMFSGTKITKDILYKILLNLSGDFVKLLSEHFSTHDNARYMPYEPSKDLFIHYEENKETILTQMAEYFYKYLVN